MFMHSTSTWISGVDSGNSAQVRGRESSEIENLLALTLPIIISKIQIPRAYMSFNIRTSNFSLSDIFFFDLAKGQNEASVERGMFIDVYGLKSVNLHMI